MSAFSAFGPAYFKWLHAGAREQGLSYARMRTLHALRCNGSQIMSSLRDELGVTARGVTGLVDALEAEDLARRVPHPTDRRATIVELTDRGRATAQGMFTAHAGRASALFARLDATDQRDLLRILHRLSAELAALEATEPRAT